MGKDRKTCCTDAGCDEQGRNGGKAGGDEVEATGG